MAEVCSNFQHSRGKTIFLAANTFNCLMGLQYLSQRWTARFNKNLNQNQNVRHFYKSDYNKQKMIKKRRLPATPANLE